jgi:L-alanine-DL-glutamate epimerase-like enolase superfamily enzyme
MDIASGEYGYELGYFRRMIEAGAVDVMQADATRCEGITGFLKAAALCEAHNLPFSAHCAPTLHIAPCCATGPAPIIEYFHDHARIEQLLFDGAPTPVGGALYPDLTRSGCGLALKRADAKRYCVMRAGETGTPR